METNTLHAGIYSDLTIGHSLEKLLGKTSLDVSCIPKISPVPSETVYIIVPIWGLVQTSGGFALYSGRGDKKI